MNRKNIFSEHSVQNFSRTADRFFISAYDGVRCPAVGYPFLNITDLMLRKDDSTSSAKRFSFLIVLIEFQYRYTCFECINYIIDDLSLTLNSPADLTDRNFLVVI